MMFFKCSANEHTLAANRKTISPIDVLKALDDIEFPEFKDRLEAELASMSSTFNFISRSFHFCLVMPSKLVLRG